MKAKQFMLERRIFSTRPGQRLRHQHPPSQQPCRRHHQRSLPLRLHQPCHRHHQRSLHLSLQQPCRWHHQRSQSRRLLHLHLRERLRHRPYPLRPRRVHPRRAHLAVRLSASNASSGCVRRPSRCSDLSTRAGATAARCHLGRRVRSTTSHGTRASTMSLVGRWALRARAFFAAETLCANMRSPSGSPPRLRSPSGGSRGVGARRSTTLWATACRRLTGHDPVPRPDGRRRTGSSTLLRTHEGLDTKTALDQVVAAPPALREVPRCRQLPVLTGARVAEARCRRRLLQVP